MPCSTLAAAPSSWEIFQTIKDLPGRLGSPRKRMLACIFREMRCVGLLAPETRICKPTQASRRCGWTRCGGCFGLAAAAWVLAWLQVHLLARQFAWDGTGAGPRVACFGLPRDEALLILAMRTPAA